MSQDTLTFDEIAAAARGGIVSYQDAFDAAGEPGDPDRAPARRRIAEAIERQRRATVEAIERQRSSRE